VTILTASHSLQDPAWPSYSRPVSIGDRAWIATGAMLLPGVSIGRGAVVGAGAVVRSNVPDFALAVGNPAVITADARSTLLIYDTAHFATPLEAWVGRPRP
jgi:maltose O-acetyltransferase